MSLLDLLAEVKATTVAIVDSMEMVRAERLHDDCVEYYRNGELMEALVTDPSRADVLEKDGRLEKVLARLDELASNRANTIEELVQELANLNKEKKELDQQRSAVGTAIVAQAAQRFEAEKGIKIISYEPRLRNDVLMVIIGKHKDLAALHAAKLEADHRSMVELPKAMYDVQSRLFGVAKGLQGLVAQYQSLDQELEFGGVVELILKETPVGRRFDFSKQYPNYNLLVKAEKERVRIWKTKQAKGVDDIPVSAVEQAHQDEVKDVLSQITLAELPALKALAKAALKGQNGKVTEKQVSRAKKLLK
jgi:hypothetical protein